MFTAIVRFSIKKKLFVGLTTLFLFIGGIYAMLTLPIDAVPDITNNQVQIVTVSPTLAPQEVEQLITMPIEIANRYLSRYILSLQKSRLVPFSLLPGRLSRFAHWSTRTGNILH